METVVNLITDPPTASLADVDAAAQRVAALLDIAPPAAFAWVADSLVGVNADLSVARREAESALHRERLGRPALAASVRAYNALQRARETLNIIEGGVRVLSR